MPSGVWVRACMAVACAVTAGAVTACGSSTSARPATNASHPPARASNQTLTIQFGPPLSLNPALGAANEAVIVYAQPAYDALTYLMPDGAIRPDLATRWGYVAGSHNKIFDLTVRRGVRFSDGSTMTGKSVAASIAYFKDADGSQADYLSNMVTARATGPYTVRLTFSSPEQALPFILSQTQGPGQIIGPKGLADPKILTTTSDGAGPYVLSASRSVANSSYVFTRNPYYWNPSAVHYGTFVVKVIQDPQTALSAAQSKQVDALGLLPSTATHTATAAHLAVYSAPWAIQSLVLADRYGPRSPLGKLKVRQALNDAVDRSTLATGLGGPGSVPSDQIALPGVQGYDAGLADRYSYDVAKAKALLAQAGYPRGFTLSVLDCAALDPNGDVAAALKTQLAAVGVTVQITETQSPAQFTPAALTKRYPAFVWPQALYPQGFTWTAKYGLVPFLNPFGTDDRTIDAMMSAVAGAAGAASDRAAQRFNAYLVDNAWYIPLFSDAATEAVTSTVAGVSASTHENPSIDPLGPTADTSWYPASRS